MMFKKKNKNKNKNDMNLYFESSQIFTTELSGENS